MTLTKDENGRLVLTGNQAEINMIVKVCPKCEQPVKTIPHVSFVATCGNCKWSGPFAECMDKEESPEVEPMPLPVHWDPKMKAKLDKIEDDRCRLLCIGPYAHLDPSRPGYKP
jgi:hypothetical protein